MMNQEQNLNSIQKTDWKGNGNGRFCCSFFSFYFFFSEQSYSVAQYVNQTGHEFRLSSCLPPPPQVLELKWCDTMPRQMSFKLCLGGVYHNLHLTVSQRPMYQGIKTQIWRWYNFTGQAYWEEFKLLHLSLEDDYGTLVSSSHLCPGHKGKITGLPHVSIYQEAPGQRDTFKIIKCHMP